MGRAKVEGPNISNVFERTFYQIALGFQVTRRDTSAGCVLAIPQPVAPGITGDPLQQPEVRTSREPEFGHPRQDGIVAMGCHEPNRQAIGISGP
jgi:hypothetical protein